MSRVLVTGAAGFIGSTLVDRLLADGHDVIGVDCFTNYYSRVQKRQNIIAACGHPRFTLIERTIAHTDWATILPDVEYVFHLAGQPGVRASWGKQFDTYLTDNIAATQILLEACVKHATRLKKFVYASTSSVYGTSVAPFSEIRLPQPISPYGVTKLAAEHLCLLYQHSYDLPTVAVRYFTVYGPRQRPDMAFHIFLKAAIEAQPLPIFGDGQQRRDFTYVRDAVDGTIRAAYLGQPGTVYNIGGGAQVSLTYALGVLGGVVGVDVLQTENVGVQRGDMRDTHADISRARVHLMYEPRTLLVDGIRAEYEWLLRTYRDVV